MQPSPRLSLPVLLALPLLAACVTINVYFPEAAVKDLSEKIETAVAREAAAAEEPGDSGDSGDSGDASEPTTGGASGPGGGGWQRSAEIALGTVLHWLGPAEALAQGDVAAPEISNPAIRKIIASRGERAPRLDAMKARGVLGENNQALVEVRDLSALPLQERAAVQKLVREENADRERMFEEIAAATGTDLSQLPQIQRTYAETLRQRARAGEWIELPDGQWKQK